MKISARNVFIGKISALKNGTVNAEVEISTAGGDKVVAIVTEASVAALGLAIGKEAVAVVKAPSVILMAGESGVRFSARNQLTGVVSALTKGGVNTEVAVTLPGGSIIHAVVTNEAVLELGLAVGTTATALIKASHVVLGVPA